MDQVDLTYITADLRPLAVPIDSVRLDPGNARTGHAVDETAESLDTYGQRKPIVVNRSENNKIEAGNGTWKSAKELGWSHIAAVFVEDDNDTAVGYAIADNRTSELSEWDSEMLATYLQALPPDVPTGFDDTAVAELLAGIEAGVASPPETFPEYDDDIETEYACPKCGYEWSGKPK